MMEIVACTDNHFIMPTGIMMYSVCVNNAEKPITFHVVIDNGVSDCQKEDLRKTIQPFPNKSIISEFIALPPRYTFP